MFLRDNFSNQGIRNYWQSILWNPRTALRSMLSVFKGRIPYQRILGQLYFNLSLRNGRNTRGIIHRNCLLSGNKGTEFQRPGRLLSPQWFSMSACSSPSLMDCLEGCKDARDCCRPSVLRCGQSVAWARIFLPDNKMYVAAGAGATGHDTAPVFKTKLQHFKLLSPPSRSAELHTLNAIWCRTGL